MLKQNHYKVLGLPESASPKEIKKKYHALAKELHPDKTGGDKIKAERFKAIAQAYSVLKDPEQKNLFDAELRGFNNTTYPSSPDNMSNRPQAWDFDAAIREALRREQEARNSTYTSSPNYFNMPDRSQRWDSDADIRRQQEARDATIRRQEEARRIQEEARRRQQELRDETIRRQQEFREETMRRQQELREEAIRRQEELREEAIRRQEEFRETIRRQQELREETIRRQQELRDETIRRQQEARNSTYPSSPNYFNMPERSQWQDSYESIRRQQEARNTPFINKIGSAIYSMGLTLINIIKRAINLFVNVVLLMVTGISAIVNLIKYPFELIKASIKRMFNKNNSTNGDDDPVLEATSDYDDTSSTASVNETNEAKAPSMLFSVSTRIGGIGNKLCQAKDYVYDVGYRNMPRFF